MTSELSLSWLSLLPTFITIFIAILTRRVMTSLLIGFFIGALLLSKGSIMGSFKLMGYEVLNLFWSLDTQTINWDQLYVLIFPLLLGALYSLIKLSGGSNAFQKWITQHVHTQKNIQLSAIGLGGILFIDDYFNSLVVGNTFRPIADKNRISRAKLAYLVDSISAPVTVLAPLSSWGAYLISLLAVTLAPYHWSELNPLSVFLYIMPLNFYAFAAIAMVVIVAYYQIDIGKMRQYEAAVNQGLPDQSAEKTPHQTTQAKDSLPGSLYDLFMPILSLVLTMLGVMLYTGHLQLCQKNMPFTVLDAMINSQVSISLFISAIAGLSTTIFLLIRKKAEAKSLLKEMFDGFKSMKIGVSILVMGWLLSSVIHQVGTGIFLSNIINNELSMHWIPALAFLCSCFISFSTGSSWASFGIMIPISASVIFNSPDLVFLIPTLAAAVSGAVFGDHCSPISDTTILSSLASGCNHMEHFITQLPYSLLCGGIALCGYLVLGLTQSGLLGALASLIAFIVVMILFYLFRRQLLVQRN